MTINIIPIIVAESTDTNAPAIIAGKPKRVISSLFSGANTPIPPSKIPIDEILLTDGKGFFFKAAISRAHPKHCEVNILEQWEQPALWNFNLHIAVAPTKNMDRMEWFAEKATEIGINAITF